MSENQVLKSLKELEQALVPVPELPEIELRRPEVREAQARQIRGNAAMVSDWVKSKLSELEQRTGMSQEAREIEAADVAAIWETINRYFEHKIPAYRRATLLAILEHEFSRELAGWAEVEALLNRLVKEGRLIAVEGGPLKVYGRTYSLPPNFCFEEPGVKEVNFSSLLFSTVSTKRRDKNKKMRRRGSEVKPQLIGRAS